jgi:hypothetical protein
MADNSDGWIKHDGGPCPVAASAMVTVKFRDGDISDGEEAGLWISATEHSPADWWKHQSTCHDEDIIAYRLHTPAQDKDTVIAELREVVEAFIAETCDYMQINNLGDPEKQHNVRLGRAILTKTGGA